MRRSGLLLHLSSLPSPWGTGDLGPESRRFAEILSRMGVSVWQMLPLNETSSVFGHSPYSPLSAFAGNPLFISPELLLAEGRILHSELPDPMPPGPARFEKASVIREGLIRAACKRGKEDREFDDFKSASKGWLGDYCMFSVLKKRFRGVSWDQWPDPYRFRDKGTLEAVADEEGERLDLLAFGQFLFFRQQKALRDFCRQREVEILGDIPIYVIHDGPDVWGNPELFQLNRDMRPSFVAGVPPDYYSENGQLWGNPLYRWEAHEAQGFRWWMDRLSHGLTLYDYIRIDHFRGLIGYWSVPEGSETAREGRWMEVPWKGFFSSLTEKFPHMPFLAEDLGVITPEVRRIMGKLGLPGMAVLQFAFDGDTGTAAYVPHNHRRSMAVYTGTHDNDTSLGWFGSAPDKTRKNLADYRGAPLDRSSVSEAMIRMALGSVAELAVIPIQDVLGLGTEARMNRPSTTKGNWVWRLFGDYPTTKEMESFGRLLTVYGRDRKSSDTKST